MAHVIVYFAHPGLHHSRVNTEMARVARDVDGVTFVDLYSEYPRLAIDVDLEQERLMSHEVVLLQFPFFWYSTPAILKEWQDLVLEHGWAYGQDGTALKGKRLIAALTAGGPEDAYCEGGYNRFELRDFLRPLEQTARLCQMAFVPPYTLFGAVTAEADGRIGDHVAGYRRLIEALRDDRFDFDAADGRAVLHHDSLPIEEKARSDG